MKDKKQKTNKPAATKAKHGWKIPRVPVPLVVFILLWLWAGVWMGDVFRMVRENSFWAPSNVLMTNELGMPLGWLWCVGRMMLVTFMRWPIIGGAVLSLILTLCCWLLGYILHLPAKWRWLQYLPLGLYTFIFTFQGYSNWIEAESGHEFGIPAAILVILAALACIVKLVIKVRKVQKVQKAEETRWQNSAQWLCALVMIGGAMVYGQIDRNYVRPTAAIQVACLNDDWQSAIKIAHDNCEISVRPLAACYAIALEETDQIGDGLFDIRLDYDSVYAKRMDGANFATDMYQMECNYYAGLVEPAYHYAMLLLTMEGPSIRSLKMLCKTAMIRNEWEVAEKYLDILDKVPFEGNFCDKWRSYLRKKEALEADEEVARIRQLEPVHDDMENWFLKPLFLGYNKGLVEGRSLNALYNSLMVNIYSKSMPGFLERLQPLVGQTPPKSISEAITLMSNKYPQLRQMFPGMQMELQTQDAFIGVVQNYTHSMEDRAAHARELFPQYKGYYPYYYMFGNLKATRKSDDRGGSSKSGVN